MAYQSRDSEVLGRQLDVQEVCVSTATPALYEDDAGDAVIHIGEAVKSVVLAVQKDDSANALVHFAAADISLANDDMDIVVAGCVLAANDVLILKYVTQK